VNLENGALNAQTSVDALMIFRATLSAESVLAENARLVMLEITAQKVYLINTY
jgi:hypothetical protein